MLHRLLHRLAFLCLIAAGLVMAGPVGAAPDSAPFTPDSYWSSPLPADAPVHPMSGEVIQFLAADNDLNGCITLSGTPGNEWGMPVYHASADDPIHAVPTRKWDVPPEFGALRIPAGAVPADNSDGELVIYDETAGYVVEFSKAEYDAATDGWTVGGGSVVYLDSNGLYGSVTGGDPRNGGSYRGYSGAVAAVHYDDVASGEIQRVHVVSIDNAFDGFLYPFTGTDGDSNDLAAPPQGARIRIKPTVDVTALGLAPEAEVIARGLQEYGFVVGDSSGGAMVLKLEDTVRSGRTETWALDRESLCAITADMLEVVLTGFTDTAGNVFEHDILTVASEKVTLGCGGWSYCPYHPVTRGQMASFLARALNLPAGPDRFDDDNATVHEASINAIAAAGITVGCTADGSRFCPDDPVTRGQMAAFLVRALGFSGGAGSDLFTDDDNSIFEPYIDQLGTAGITRGCNPPDNDQFCPQDLVTRGQMAAFLSRGLYGGS